jgi:hypothetical protein
VEEEEVGKESSNDLRLSLMSWYAGAAAASSVGRGAAAGSICRLAETGTRLSTRQNSQKNVSLFVFFCLSLVRIWRQMLLKPVGRLK